ncbi:unnamed protein product [Arctia plantaginis]|uniref:RNase H type-1 domain-containing protein n=1 Tax=Arctia plantaginis TaxID=874455 RepID=A0A8S1B817_ARCPL|nr:unnamed protein product [Arctia plantaginis]CAB3252858.1 unnamed protein product [Arctia plantaginis]
MKISAFKREVGRLPITADHAVSLEWMKDHRRFEGNVAADKLAKTCAMAREFIVISSDIFVFISGEKRIRLQLNFISEAMKAVDR